MQTFAAALFCRCGEGERVLGEFKRMTVSFNAYGHAELEGQLRRLEDVAGDVEAEKDPVYGLLRLEYRKADEEVRAANRRFIERFLV